MTKVRVCVGVNKQGKYHAYGESHLTDESLREIVLFDKGYDPGLSFSFHDLEVMTPQAPVVEALSSEGHTFKRGDRVTRMQNGLTQYWKVVEPVPNEDGMIVLLVEGMELRANDTWAVLVEQLGKFSCGYHYRMSYEDDCTLVPEVTAPQGLKPGDMVVDQSGEIWDVNDTSGNNYYVWLRPVGKLYMPRDPVPAHTLKKVVFGTL